MCTFNINLKTLLNYFVGMLYRDKIQYMSTNIVSYAIKMQHNYSKPTVTKHFVFFVNVFIMNVP